MAAGGHFVMADSAANSALRALGYALFTRETSGALRITGGSPDWLKSLWPEIGTGNNALDSGVSPFLENFLIDAEECWRAGGEKRANSGPWIEQDAQGSDVQLEATALSLDGQAVLLLERLGEAFETRKVMLQKARENVIAYQRLNSEIQKKEILLHCVAEEMTASLANVITSLRLLEQETNSPTSKRLLGLANRATDQQQALIHKVLSVFAEELSGLFGQNGDGPGETDLLAAIREAIERNVPAAAEKKIRLTSPASATEAKVSIDSRHLERALTNLIENAIERTPTGGEIMITLADEPESFVVNVEDNGTTMPPDACENLFSPSEHAARLPHAFILRLQFCRMIAENCGGEIGCAVREGRGNRFWIRLPKVSR